MEHKPYPLQLKITPGDVVKHDDKFWVALAISIMDGQTVMFARINNEEHKYLEYKNFKPTIDDTEYAVAGKDVGWGDRKHIMDTDHSPMLDYF